jgi:predicted DNA-binding protein YlxM (UPF0122 family)
VRLYIIERLSLRKIADLLGVSHMTVHRAICDPELEVLL